MRIFIKFFIALVFIVGSYTLGYYSGLMVCENQLIPCRKQVIVQSRKIKELQDSLNLLNSKAHLEKFDAAIAE